MKVILKEDVKSLGKKGEIVNVSDGYARNFILKTGKGVEADTKHLNELKQQNARDERIAQEELLAARELGALVEKGNIILTIKTGESGKAFGSISSKEIAQEMEKQMKLTVDKKKIQLKEQIKTTGDHIVPVRLHPRVTANLKVTVNEEV